MPLLERAPLKPFRDHAYNCPRCRAVDPERPASLALACLDGSSIIKAALNELWNQSRRPHPSRRDDESEART